MAEPEQRVPEIFLVSDHTGEQVRIAHLKPAIHHPGRRLPCVVSRQAREGDAGKLLEDAASDTQGASGLLAMAAVMHGLYLHQDQRNDAEAEDRHGDHELDQSEAAMTSSPGNGLPCFARLSLLRSSPGSRLGRHHRLQRVCCGSQTCTCT